MLLTTVWIIDEKWTKCTVLIKQWKAASRSKHRSMWTKASLCSAVDNKPSLFTALIFFTDPNKYKINAVKPPLENQERKNIWQPRWSNTQGQLIFLQIYDSRKYLALIWALKAKSSMILLVCSAVDRFRALNTSENVQIDVWVLLDINPTVQSTLRNRKPHMSWR